MVVGNRDDDDDGFVGDRFGELGASFRRYVREEPSGLDGAEVGADVVVLLGSDWSVYDETHAESVRAEMDLVARAQRDEVPVLGICFGGQLISRSLGLDVGRCEVPEIGWRTLSSLDDAALHPGPWFQYHFDRWFAGPGIPQIASSSSGPQAYWFGKTLSLQFHPEVTEATIRRWCEEGRDSIEGVGEDLDTILADTTRHIGSARARCYELVDRFLSTSERFVYPERPTGAN